MSPLPSLPLREEGTLTGNGTATSPLSVVSPYTGVTHDGTLTGNGTPASPLKVTSPYTGVAHDGTLTGNGTLASPLSVAAPAGGSLTVFDANGALVGKYDGGVILRKLGDTWMRLGYEDVNGVVASSIGGTLVLYYETTDCTGPAYLPGEFGLVGSAYSGVPPYTTIVFAVGPPLTITARAIGEDNIDFLEPLAVHHAAGRWGDGPGPGQDELRPDHARTGAALPGGVILGRAGLRSAALAIAASTHANAIHAAICTARRLAFRTIGWRGEPRALRTEPIALGRLGCLGDEDRELVPAECAGLHGAMTLPQRSPRRHLHGPPRRPGDGESIGARQRMRREHKPAHDAGDECRESCRAEDQPEDLRARHGPPPRPAGSRQPVVKILKF